MKIKYSIYEIKGKYHLFPRNNIVYFFWSIWHTIKALIRLIFFPHALTTFGMIQYYRTLKEAKKAQKEKNDL